MKWNCEKGGEGRRESWEMGCVSYRGVQWLGKSKFFIRMLFNLMNED